MISPNVEQRELCEGGEGAGEGDEGEIHVETAIQPARETVAGVVDHLQQTRVCGGAERGGETCVIYTQAKHTVLCTDLVRGDVVAAPTSLRWLPVSVPPRAAHSPPHLSPAHPSPRHTPHPPPGPYSAWVEHMVP